MTSREHKLSKLAFRFGLLGLVGHLIGLIIAYLAFSDFNQQGFSFLNFSLSELGQYGHSELAVVFNGGLFFGSLSLVLFFLFSLQNSDEPWLYPSFILAIIALLGLAITGLFPINVYHLHKFGIEYFFHCAALSIVSYFIYLIRHPKQDKRFASKGAILLSLVAIVVFTLFIVLAHVDMGMVADGRWFYHDMARVEPRPQLWWPSLLEWLSFMMFMVWVFSLAWSQRASRRS